MVKLQLSEWLRPEDLKTGDKISFVDEGRAILEEENRYGDFEIKIKLPDGKEKMWSPNKTTQREIAKEYGLDTSNWIGKQAIVEISEQNVRGEMKKVIYGKPVKQVEDAGEVVSPNPSPNKEMAN